MKRALDVDGVLADFYLAMCTHCNMPVENIYEWNSPWIFEQFHKVENDYEFWANLPVLNGPETIDFDFDYYITSIPEDMKSAREEWLKKNGYPDKPVIISFEKTKTMKELGVNIIIDDKYETIKEVHDSGLVGIHYLPYYLHPEEFHHVNTRNFNDIKNIVFDSQLKN